MYLHAHATLPERIVSAASVAIKTFLWALRAEQPHAWSNAALAAVTALASLVPSAVNVVLHLSFKRTSVHDSGAVDGITCNS